MKKTIIIVSSFLGLIALFFMIEYFASPVKDVTSKAEMKMTTGAKMEYVPTKDELVKIEGDQLQLLGIYTVVGIHFDRHSYVTLANAEQEEINFSISIIDKQKQTFSIPAIQFSPQNLQLSDSFGIAKKKHATLLIKKLSCRKCHSYNRLTNQIYPYKVYSIGFIFSMERTSNNFSVYFFLLPLDH